MIGPRSRSFSKSLGKEAAVFAGLGYVKGNGSNVKTQTTERETQITFPMD